ncbi:hypothetical protein Bca52824_022053 [Brassica carinata]|uniref:Reverse transcriptase n=1 Tax=Brassica carinata TaxID=52824 RepID=A0A8X7VFW9_BRACI|nr:hypothetical protein Bca52824_022053 [Brassica carinata]
MSSHLDKALLHLSLEEEEEEPFVLPDTPEYCSAGRNSLSLVGRLLNPSCQRMSDLILDMPRKWQLYDREGVGNSTPSSAESKNSVATERLDEEDPLYGIIPDKLLGMDVVTGKPKIALEVLEGMRTYLMVAEGPEKAARVERVRKSLEDLENDPIGRKTTLMLEAPPSITSDLDKGKGVVFDFSAQGKETSDPDKLMASAITAGLRGNSTGFNTGFFETSASGTTLKKVRARRRPGTFKRKNNGKAAVKGDSDSGKKVGEGMNSVYIDFKFVDKHLLDLHVQFGKFNFFVSCVYGEPARSDRPRLWERLSRIGVYRKEPWCMVGDFNEIRNKSEKIGGPRRSEMSFQPFNNMLEIGEMVELQSSGDSFTWGGNRGTLSIQSKLDRCFGNKKWFQLFPTSNQVFMDKRGSDHRPVMVKLFAATEARRGSFRFDGRFLFKNGVREEIKKAWTTNHPFFEANVSERLKRCRKALSNWKKKENLNSRDKIRQIQGALEREQSELIPAMVRINFLKAELVNAYKEEEQYWKQRCKERWATKGDLNTKYYHASVKSNRARKRIIKLLDNRGQTHFSEEAKGKVAVDYFQNLFKTTSDGDYSEMFEGLIHLIQKAVDNGSIQGIQFSDRGPMIHHMLFADDSLLICKASDDQARKLMEILKIYERATGQLVNVAKSAITFGAKIRDCLKLSIKAITGISKEGGSGSYLGLPECFSGSKTEILAYIYDRLKDRLSGWFTKAKIGSRPSYAWRSIQFGKELLSQGLRKHVGNGRTVSVWTDLWIEGEVRRAPLMKNILVNIELKVSDLIDFQNRSWYLDKLHELFYEEDVATILKMKTVFDQEDYWVWLHNRNGSYSVRSGYWFINRLVRSEVIREAEARPSLNDLKAEVWKIPTSPKIKSFIWRAVSNAIPVGELLVKRGIKLDPICQACGFQGESVNHIIFHCPVARQVWALANVPYPEGGFDEVSHFSNFHTLMLMMKNSSIPEEVRISIPWIVWYLWKFRNGILFEARSRTAPDVVAKALEEAEFWFLAQKNEGIREKEDLEAVTFVKKSWSGPPRGWLKGNIGVDWNSAQNSCGAAWVVRDEGGKVRLHSRRAFSNISTREEAKFQAMIWAIESFHSHHLNRIIIAIDDATLPSIILRPRAWPSFKYQYGEIMRRLEKIEWWRLEKEDRTTNRGSFIIAQSVFKGGYLQSYVATGAPFWLRELFENEERASSVGVCS